MAWEGLMELKKRPGIDGIEEEAED